MSFAQGVDALTKYFAESVNAVGRVAQKFLNDAIAGPGDESSGSSSDDEGLHDDSRYSLDDGPDT